MVVVIASRWFRCRVTVVVVARFLAVKLRTVDDGEAPVILAATGVMTEIVVASWWFRDFVGHRIRDFVGHSTSSATEQEVFVKAIKMKNDVYDCAITNLAKFQASRQSGVGLGDNACPVGTVPILRAHSDLPSSDMPNSSIWQKPQKHCCGIVHTNNLSWKLLGASGGLTLYKPFVTNDQWSSARVKLLNNDESIEAGWMVNPWEFKDYEAHFYAKFKTTKGGCINLECPGFVQVSKSVPLGAVPTSYSKHGRQQFYWTISISKVEGDDAWWLFFGGEKVGYWPKKLFTTLSEYANQADWGGEIDNPEKTRPIPQMGNGYFASYNFKKSASVIQATIVNSNYKSVSPGPDTHKMWDCEQLYTVKDAGYKGEFLGRLLLYGGPNL
ncbi:hypothetical protein BVRB_5g124650 [Beta vulgaris subsp. vulgaris]|nr:hypothetical protein BVRB_5g124650 [Beta vulgaris subsp. vulgaris]